MRKEIKLSVKALFGLSEDFYEWKRNNHFFQKRTIFFFLVGLAISFVGFSSLLFASYNYIDDIQRNLSGGNEWGFNFFRWIIFLENHLLQLNGLADASPLIQLFAIFFLSSSSIVLAYVFSLLAGSHKIRIENFISSLLIIFNPYFLECMSYKYESVGMATSVFVSVIPFLFLEKPRLFYFISFICMLLMPLSYQASSGIYIVLVILIGAVKYVKSEESCLKVVLKFYLFSGIAYIVATIIFYLLCTFFTFGTYRSITITFRPSVIVRNLSLYLSTIINDFSIVWIVLFVIITIFAIIAILKMAESGKKIKAFLFFLISFMLSIVLSYGAYIFLKDTATSPRMMYGIGIFIAVIANIAVCQPPAQKRARNLSVLFVFLLCWSFFCYSIIYGNALSYQQDFESMYEQMILDDLNELLPVSDEQYKVGLIGTPGFSPVVEHIARFYPITTRLVPNNLNGLGYFSGLHMILYYVDFLSIGYDRIGSLDISQFEKIKETISYDILLENNDVAIVFK